MQGIDLFFKQYVCIYLAVLCLSCSTWSLCFIMRNLSLWHVGSVVALWYVGSEFPDQGSNLQIFSIARQVLNHQVTWDHWISREGPCIHLLVFCLFFVFSWAVLGLHCYLGIFLVVVRGGYSLVVV